MPPRPRRRYSLRSGCHEQRACILDSLSQSGSPSPDGSVPTASNDSAYYTSSPGSSSSASPAHASAVCSMRPRSTTWASSLRSILKRIPKNSPTKQVEPALQAEAVSLAGLPDDRVPTTEEEIDTFLAEVWRRDVTDNPRTTSSPVSSYIKRVTELKEFFDQKMAEISQREATYLSELTYFDETTPLISASQISTLDGTSLRKMVIESKLGYKLENLRLKMKQEAVSTVLALRTEYITQAGAKKSRKLKPKATKTLTKWFEAHLDHPYPNEAEKQLLASESGVTVEQVTTWFCNKRSRSKKMRGLYGRKDKTRTL